MRKTSVFVAAVVSLFALFFNDAAYAVDALPLPDATTVSQPTETSAPIEASTSDPTETATPAPDSSEVPDPTLTPAQAPVDPALQQSTLSIVPMPVIVQVPQADLNSLVAWSGHNGVDPDYVYHRALTGIAAELSESQIAELKQLIPAAKVMTDTVVTTDTTQSNAPWNLSTLDEAGSSPDSSYKYPASAGAGVKVYVVDTGVSPNSQFGTRLLTGVDFTGSGTTKDCNGHGTHVAGTVASTTYGVAKKSYIVPVHVLGPTTTCDGSGQLSDVVRGIEWAIADNPAGTRAVLNMSLGAGGSNSALTTAVNNAIADGIVVVVAAGNDGIPACYSTPASIPGAVTVGAVDRTNHDASFSNYGTCVDLYAPGVGVTSLDAQNPGGTQTWDGTSMASPHVAGIAALWLADHPGDTVSQVTAAIISSAEPNVVTFRSRSFAQESPNRVADIRGFTPSPLSNTTPPTTSVTGGTPSGAPRLGGTITATAGVWTAGSQLSYQWYSCLRGSDSNETILPDGCSAIPFEIQKTLSVNSDTYLGMHLLVGETASVVTDGDVTQSDVVYSASKGPVSQAPVNTLAPSLSGSSGVGSTLTADDGQWQGSPEPTLSRQWYSCATAVDTSVSTLPSGCAAITGATDTTYVIARAQLDKFIIVEAKALNASVASAVSQFSASTAVVTEAPVNVTAPLTSIRENPGANGTPRYVEGGASSLMSVSAGAWTGTQPRTLTYQWFHCTQSHDVVPDFVTLTDDCEFIEASTDVTLRLTSDNVAKYVGAVVTATNSLGASSVGSATSSVVNATPIAMVEPVIEGDPIAGSTLTLNRGTWVGSPTPTFTYQWLSCTSAYPNVMNTKPSDCSVIANATSTTFALTSSYKGKHLMVMVKAMNNAVPSPTIRYTASTSSILVLPTLATAPSIGLTVGSTYDPNNAPSYRPGAPTSTSLTVTPGVWSGTATIEYSYEWYRCDAAQLAGADRDGSCLLIDGVNSRVYQVTSDDVGHTLVVGEIASNAAGTVRTYTKSSLHVSQAPRATAAPTISGAVTEGNPLSLSGGSWEGTPSPAYAYQWLACTAEVSSSAATAPAANRGCSDISGATAARFIPRHAQSGKYIVARISATNSASSSPTVLYTASTLSAVNPAPSIVITRPGADLAPIVVQATPASTSLLTAYDANNQVAGSAQWYRCDAAHEAESVLADGCAAISGASNPTYTPTLDDLGSWILAEIGTSDSGGVPFTATTPGAVGAPPVNTVVPAVEGSSIVVGGTVTANPGEWSGTPTPTLTYQWFKCTSATSSAATVPAGCSAIAGATADFLVVQDAYKDLYLAVRVSATNSTVTSAGAAIRMSASTTKVLVEPSSSIAVRVSSSVTADTGAPVVGATLSAVAGTWKGTGPFTYSYQWQVCESVVDANADALPQDCLDIDGATGKSFTANSDYAGKYITVTETVSNAAATEQRWATASLTVASKPARLSEPGITGTAARGETLTANTGDVTGSPTPGYSYSWLRCTTAQATPLPTRAAACAVISGATSSTYRLVSADVAKFIAVTVVATNSAGKVSRTSASTAAILDPVGLTALPAPTVGSPAADSSPRVGGTVSTTGGAWAGNPTSKSYQWYSCTTSLSQTSTTEPQECALIDGATGSSFTLGVDHISSYLSVRVIAANAVSTATVWSPTTAKDVVQVPVSDTAVSIDATHTIGESVTATAGTWIATPGETVTYSWFRCTSPVAEPTTTAPPACSEIPNSESGLSHRLIAGDINKYVLIAEKATNRAGVTRVFSASSEQVVAPPSFDGTIDVSGNAWIGRSVQVTGDTFGGAPTPTKTYQWLICDSLYAPGYEERPEDCAPIESDDATTTTLAVIDDYEARYLMVEVTATNVAGELIERSGAMALVKRIPVNIAAPSISGTPGLNQELSADAGTWSGTEPMRFEYQWFRCATKQLLASATVPSGCTSIFGAMNHAYTLTDADIEKYLVVRTTAKNETEDVSKFSPSTDIVSTQPRYSTGLKVTVFSAATTGAPRAGGEVRTVVGTWTARPAPTYTYQWYVCPAKVAGVTTTTSSECVSVEGATGANLTVTRDMVGLFPRVKVTASTLAGTDSRYSMTTGLPVLTPPFATTVPGVSGYPFVKATLSATAGVWEASPESKQTYSWFLCDSEVPSSVTSKPASCSAIANQTKSTLPVLEAYRDKYISSMVTATNAAGTVKQWSVSTPAIKPGPVNTVAPTLTTNPAGVAKVDGTISVARGTWVGEPVPSAEDDEYAWYICDSPVAAASLSIDTENCSLIYGETYADLVVPNQLEMYLLAAVTAHNEHGSYTIYTKTSGAISSAPANETPPALSNSNFVGQAIEATAGSYSGSPEPSVTVRWWSCETQRASETIGSPDSSDCVLRPGTTSFYTPSDDDTGRYIVVEETATNRAGSLIVWSASSEIIRSGPVNKAAPTIAISDPASNGAPFVSGTVSTTGGTWSGNPTPTKSYQWLRCSSKVTTSALLPHAGCSPIDGAENSEYSPVSDDASFFLAVAVTGTNAYGEATIVSATTALAVRMAPVMVTPPQPRGVLYVQGVARAKEDAWLGFPAPSKTYQWYVCSSPVDSDAATLAAGCTEANDGANASYTIPVSQRGKFLVVRITASNGEGSPVSRYSASSPEIVDGPVNTANPVISGTARVGRDPLVVSEGEWVPLTNAPTMTYQWYRCDREVSSASDELASDAGCVALDGDTASTHTIVESDAGKALLVAVTGTNSIGSTTRYTKSSAKTTEQLRMLSGPYLSGAAQSGTVLHANEGSWRGFPLPVVKHVWYRCKTAVVAGATIPLAAGCTKITLADANPTDPEYELNSSTDPQNGDIGKYIVFSVTKTIAGDSPPTITAVSASVGPVTEVPNFRGVQPYVESDLPVRPADAHPRAGDRLKVTDNLKMTTAGGATVTRSVQWYRCDSAFDVASLPAAELALPEDAGCTAIDGATGVAYTVTDDDMQKFVTAAVTGTNSAGARSWLTKKPTLQVQSVPVIDVAPTVTGTRTAGSVLTLTDGEWSAFPSGTITREWYRCDKPIAVGQTNPTWPLTTPAQQSCTQINVVDDTDPSDGIGLSAYTQLAPEGDRQNDPTKYITAKVSYRNDAGETVYLVAAPNELVTASAPTVVHSPIVDCENGTCRVGNLLTVSGDSWTGAPAPQVDYQWFDCPNPVTAASDTLAVGCVAIDGATTNQYYMISANAGKYLLASATAHNDAGSVTRYSVAKGPISAGYANETVPTATLDDVVIPSDGSSIAATATAGVWSGSVTINKYWIACTSPITTPVIDDIPNGCVVAQENADLTLDIDETFAYAGMYLAYGEEATWSTGVIRSVISTTTPRTQQAPLLWTSLNEPSTPQNNRVYVQPNLSGPAPNVGVQARLTAGAWSKTYELPTTATTWRGSPIGTVTQQWFRCTEQHSFTQTSSTPIDCAAISGATGITYTPVHADASNYLVARMVATNEAGTLTIFTASTAAVTEKPVNVDAPDITFDSSTGHPIKNTVLSLGNGSWNAFPEVAADGYAYKWFKCTANVASPSNTKPASCAEISGQTSSTFTVTASYAGFYLVGSVTATNAGGSAIKFSSSTPQVYEQPSSKTPPTVEGKPDVGQTLTAKSPTTSWSGAPEITSSDLTYQWFACDAPITASSPNEAVGASCSALAGQTSSVISLTSATRTKYVVVRVKATNEAGVAYASSTSSTQVKEKARNTEAPAFATDDDVAGATLTATDGSWQGFPAPTLTRQWYVCTGSFNEQDSVPSSCTIQTGKTTSSLQLTDAMAGKYVLVAVTATTALNNGPVTTVKTTQTRGPIRNMPKNTGDPTIGGTAHRGETLTAAPGTWAGVPAPTTSYKWYQCAADSVTSSASNTLADGCFVIDGADNAPLTLTSDHVNTKIVLEVTGSNSVGDKARYSKGTAVVSSSPTARESAPPVISGTTKYANGTNTVTVSTGGWDGFPTANTFAYAWFSCATSSAASPTQPTGCVPVTGSTATIKMPTSASGRYLVAKVTASAPVNKASASSASTYSASYGPIETKPVNVSVPTISNTAPRNGNTLSANVGTWTGYPTPTTEYDWYKCGTTSISASNAVPAGCTIIVGTHNTDLTLGPNEVGRRILLVVKATNSTGAIVTKTSASTAVVGAATVSSASVGLLSRLFWREMLR